MADPLSGLDAKFRAMWSSLYATVRELIRAELRRWIGRIVIGGKVIPGAVQASATASQVLTTQTVNGQLVAAWGPGGPADTSYAATMGSDVTMATSATYYPGPSFTLPAGSFLVRGALTITAAGAAIVATVKLWDGTTVYKMEQQAIPAGGSATIRLSAFVAPAASTTYTLAASAA